MTDYQYKNECCPACGIPRVSDKYFQDSFGKLVRCTADHNLLHSLGGSNTAENLTVMCEKCNTLRSNWFAELPEFLEWFKLNGATRPPEKNFCYINQHIYDSYWYIRTCAEDKKLKSKNLSVPGETFLRNGVMYRRFKHPVFGESTVKVTEEFSECQ